MKGGAAFSSELQATCVKTLKLRQASPFCHLAVVSVGMRRFAPDAPFYFIAEWRSGSQISTTMHQMMCYSFYHLISYKSAHLLKCAVPKGEPQPGSGRSNVSLFLRKWMAASVTRSDWPSIGSESSWFHMSATHDVDQDTGGTEQYVDSKMVQKPCTRCNLWKLMKIHD